MPQGCIDDHASKWTLQTDPSQSAHYDNLLPDLPEGIAGEGVREVGEVSCDGDLTEVSCRRPDRALEGGDQCPPGGHTATVESTARVSQEVNYCAHLTHPQQHVVIK